MIFFWNFVICVITTNELFNPIHFEEEEVDYLFSCDEICLLQYAFSFNSQLLVFYSGLVARCVRMYVHTPEVSVAGASASKSLLYKLNCEAIVEKGRYVKFLKLINIFKGVSLFCF